LIVEVREKRPAGGSTIARCSNARRRTCAVISYSNMLCVIKNRERERKRELFAQTFARRSTTSGLKRGFVASLLLNTHSVAREWSSRVFAISLPRESRDEESQRCPGEKRARLERSPREIVHVIGATLRTRISPSTNSSTGLSRPSFTRGLHDSSPVHLPRAVNFSEP